MGRLSYINRKIEGLKLGQVVAKDLVKRVPPGTASKAALRDPSIEIDVSGKQIKDEGFAEIVPALVEALQFEGNLGKVALLEDLCLKDNGLTTASLKLLAPVIKLVCNDLRDLDLSNNSITIETPEEVDIWEEFLSSFAGCCVLRRLDLSGNAISTKGFETLARVFANEAPLDPLVFEDFESPNARMEGNLTLDSDNNAELSRMIDHMSVTSNSKAPINNGRPPESDVKHTVSRHDSKSPEKASDPALDTTNRTLYNKTRGLHSVPYIVLSETSMNDHGALYLSYITAIHQTPDLLLTRVPQPKAGHAQQQLIHYDAKSGCRGVIYLPNKLLSSTALKILDLSEKRRDKLVAVKADEEDVIAEKIALSKSPAKQISTTKTQSPSSHHKRKASSIGPEHGPSSLHASVLSDLDRARSRVQGEILDSDKKFANDLWRTTLAMLALSRNLQLRKPLRPTKAPAPKPKMPIIKTLEIPGVSPRRPKSQPPTVLPLSNVNPNKSIIPRYPGTEKLNSPALSNIAARPVSSNMAVGSSRTPLELDRRPYTSKLLFGFSEEIWRRIISYATGAEAFLSKRQQIAVLSWAMEKETLNQEREWLPLKESIQIWHLLDSLNCLAYERRE